MKNLTITNTYEIKTSKKFDYLIDLMTKLELDPSKPVPGMHLFDESTQSWHQPFDLYYTINGNRQFITFSHMYDQKIQEMIERCQKKLYPNPYPQSITYLIQLLDELKMFPSEPIFLEKRRDKNGKWVQPIEIDYYWEQEQKRLIIPDLWDNNFIQNLIKRSQKQLYGRTKTDGSTFNLNSKCHKIYRLMTQLGLKPQEPKPQLKSYDEEIKRWIQPVIIAYTEDGTDKILMIEDMYDDTELNEIIDMFDYKSSSSIDYDFFE